MKKPSVAQGLNPALRMVLKMNFNTLVGDFYFLL